MIKNNDQPILITGVCGFIGFHLAISLLEDGYKIAGLDNISDYYDVNLKYERLSILKKNRAFKFYKIDISNKSLLDSTFKIISPNKVVNLAAQAGVRYSLENPNAYIDTNISGFMNVLECCRYNEIEGLIYASSSSVYGSNIKVPFSVEDRVDNPISIYAASKLANELMAHSYSHLFNLNTTGLRFFTVYGPWGRPDMAMYIFAKSILNNKPIKVFNNGNMKRDFTYIDDIINGIRSSIDKNYKCEIFNLGNNRTENLLDMINIIELVLGLKATIEFEGMQKGDVGSTYADIDHSRIMLDYNPRTNIKDGIPKFISWLKKYHK